MAKDALRTGAGARGPAFLVMVALVVYVMFSVAAAVTTLKDCEKEGKGQHWAPFPPHWVCETPGNVSPN
jgi:hypothetical protein